MSIACRDGLGCGFSLRTLSGRFSRRPPAVRDLFDPRFDDVVTVGSKAGDPFGSFGLGSVQAINAHVPFSSSVGQSRHCFEVFFHFYFLRSFVMAIL